MAGSNVEVTGGVTVMQGGVDAVLGQETVASLFGFGANFDAPNNAVQKFPDGTFSVSDWKGYPKGEAIPQPPKNTTFRLIEGDEYAAALKAKTAANRKYRRENNIPNGYEVHEIVPVKYGGSPTDPANKYVLSADYHRKVVSPWWAKLKGSLE